MRRGGWRGELAPSVARYGSGVAAVAAATLARWWLHPMFGSHRPFVTYFIALPLIAWYAGLGPTLLTLLLGGLAAEVFFMEPGSVFAMHDALDVRGPGLYAVLGLAIALVTAALRRTVEALRRSRAGSRAAVEGAFDCIITMDHEGRITAFNPAAERTFGYPRAAVIGRRMAEVIIPPPLRERHHRVMAHYLAMGEGPILGRRLELTALRADGSEFPIELTINVMRLARRRSSLDTSGTSRSGSRRKRNGSGCSRRNRPRGADRRRRSAGWPFSQKPAPSSRRPSSTSPRWNRWRDWPCPFWPTTA